MILPRPRMHIREYFFFFLLLLLLVVVVVVLVVVVVVVVVVVAALSLREDLSTGYRLRFSAEIYGSKRFSTNASGNIVLFLQKSPKSPETSGSLRENVI